MLGTKPGVISALCPPVKLIIPVSKKDSIITQIPTLSFVGQMNDVVNRGAV